MAKTEILYQLDKIDLTRDSFFYKSPVIKHPIAKGISFESESLYPHEQIVKKIIKDLQNLNNPKTNKVLELLESEDYEAQTLGVETLKILMREIEL